MPVIPSYMENEVERITVPGQPRQKRPHLHGKKLGVVALACHSSNDKKPEIGES
jgi:hypothetical protein